MRPWRRDHGLKAAKCLWASVRSRLRCASWISNAHKALMTAMNVLREGMGRKPPAPQNHLDAHMCNVGSRGGLGLYTPLPLNSLRPSGANHLMSQTRAPTMQCHVTAMMPVGGGTTTTFRRCLLMRRPLDHVASVRRASTLPHPKRRLLPKLWRRKSMPPSKRARKLVRNRRIPSAKRTTSNKRSPQTQHANDRRHTCNVHRIMTA